jgi:hypothetical protein
VSGGCRGRPGSEIESLHDLICRDRVTEPAGLRFPTICSVHAKYAVLAQPQLATGLPGRCSLHYRLAKDMTTGRGNLPSPPDSRLLHQTDAKPGAERKSMRLPSVLSPAFALAVFVVVVTAAAHATNHGERSHGLYFVGDFETCDFSQWKQVGPTNAFRIARSRRAQGRCAGVLSVGPQAQGTWNGRSDATALAAPGRPPEYGTSGQTVWQHFSILFPHRFRSTPGEWNWVTEWHNDEGYKPFVSSGQLRWEFSNISWTIRNTRGYERLAMRIIGGSSRSPRKIWVIGPALRRNHWYDFLVRTTWSPRASDGFVQWWLDGKRLFSRQAATLYTRPDGSVSSVYFMQNYYRVHATWTTKIFFDGTRLGGSRKSVQYSA